jgi:uncharacterized damage-inducible protein DinB
MANSASIAPFYAGWQLHQQRLTRAIAPLTPDQLRLQAAPGMLSVGVLAAHILGARAFWFHDIMGEGPPEIAGWLGLDDEEDSARPVERLVAGLEATWAMIEGVLARCTPADLEAKFQRVTPGRVRTYTRQMLIWRVMEHDIHHTGEISLTLGMHGLPGLAEEYPTLTDSAAQ